MADPVRLQIKIKLAEWLEGITPANGFQHDLSSTDGTVRVFRGRDKFGEGDPLPCAAIIEPLNPDRDIDETGAGRVVNEASMRDGDTYKIYFEPMDRARVVKHRVVEEEYHAPK